MNMRKMVVLCAAIAASLPLVADKEVVDGIEWNYTIADGTAMLGNNVTAKRAVSYDVSGDLIVPETLGGYPVTALALSAFRGCSNLTSVTLPRSVTTLGFMAFCNCIGLTNMVLHSNVRSINGSAFAGCTRLSMFEVEAGSPYLSVVDGLLCNKSGNILIACPASFEMVNIPSCVRRINSGAFQGCRYLTSIHIPNTVVDIRVGAFRECGSLTSFELADDHPNYALVDGLLCDKEGKSVISCPTALSPVTLPDSITNIEAYVFSYCCGLTRVKIPEEMKVINQHTFSYNPNLEEVIFSNGLTNIDDSAFLNCTSLRSVILPDGLKRIGSYAFNKDAGVNVESSLSEVYIPASVTQIGSANATAFAGQTNISNVTFPSAFALPTVFPNSCMAITNAVVVEGSGIITSNAFFNCSALQTIYIPASVSNIAEGAFGGCKSLERIVLDPANPYFTLVDGALYDRDVTRLISCPAKVTLTNLPNTLTRICDYAFSDSAYMETIAIPESVKTIGSFAFQDSLELMSMEIPETVEEIGADVFAGCVNLSRLIMPEHLKIAPRELKGTVRTEMIMKRGMVYRVTGTMWIVQDAVLTIEPGAIVKFDPGVRIVADVGGTVRAIGTRSSPCIFTSIKDDEHGGDTNGDGDQTIPQPGDWLRLDVYDGGTLELEHVKILYASGQRMGGSVRVLGGGYARIVDSEVAHAAFDAIGVESGGNTFITNCVVRDALAAFRHYNTNDIVNCVVYDCGRITQGGSHQFRNCVFSEITEVWQSSQQPKNFRNCCFWNAGGMSLTGDVAWQTTNTNIKTQDASVYVGKNGNVWGDPLFTDPVNGDFRIQKGSACIDIGSAEYALELDFYGQPRVTTTDEPVGLALNGGGVPDAGICEMMKRAQSSDIDLAAISVSATGPVAPGDEIDVRWAIDNRGGVAVDGSWRDTVSLVSANGRVITLGEKETTGRIPAGGSLNCHCTFTVPAIAEGVWYPKVQLNTYRDIFEGSLTENNAIQGTEPVEVAIAAADMSGEVAGQIAAGIPVVVKLPFAEDAVNRLVRMVLPEGAKASWGFGFLPQGEASSGAAVASGSDVLFLAPDGEQTVYVLLESGNTGNYSLTFENNPLVISSISPTSIPKSGTTSIIVTGAGFTPSNTVSFTSASGAVAPESVRYVNANTLVATVDCAKFTSGATYAAETSVGVLVTSLSDTLTVMEEEGKGEFWAKLFVPDTVRKGRVCSCYVEYGNSGDVDVLSPVLQIVMEGDGMLGYVDRNADLKLLQFIAAGENTHAGIVSPGYTGRCYFKLLSGTQNRISLCPSVGTEVYDSNWDSHDSYMLALSKAADRCAIVGENAQDYSTVYDFALNVRKSGSISTVYGKVTDYDGRANSGYVLRLNDLVSSNDVQTIVENGHYLFKDVVPGVYSIQCDGANLCLATNVIVDTNSDVGCDLHIDVPCTFSIVPLGGTSFEGLNVIAYDDMSEVVYQGFQRTSAHVDLVGLRDGIYNVSVCSNDVTYAGYRVNVVGGVASNSLLSFENHGVEEVVITIDDRLCQHSPTVFIISYSTYFGRTLLFSDNKLQDSFFSPCGEYVAVLAIDDGTTLRNNFVLTKGSPVNVSFTAPDSLNGSTSSNGRISLMSSGISFDPRYIESVVNDYLQEWATLYYTMPSKPTGEYDCKESWDIYNKFMNTTRTQFLSDGGNLNRVFDVYIYNKRLYEQQAHAFRAKSVVKAAILICFPEASSATVFSDAFIDKIITGKSDITTLLQDEAIKLGLSFVPVASAYYEIERIRDDYRKVEHLEDVFKNSEKKLIEEARKFGPKYPAYQKKLRMLPTTYVKCPKQEYPPSSSEDRKGNQSKDPNEMAGPIGDGDPETQRFLEPGQKVTYTVYYENQTNATAAAQEVFVTNSLSQYLDWSTFEMGEVAFGDQIDLGLVGKQNGTNEVTMTGTNLIVRTIVDLDKTKGEVRWYQRVIDPNSGDTWPVDVTGGFLPPNNEETHCGEGHLTYTIQVRDDVPRGVRIDNSATIVFDTNDPITTDPAWWNIVTPENIEVVFGKAELVVNEGESVSVSVYGGNIGKASSAKVYLTYNTAASADLDLAKGAVGDETPKGGLKFPLTLSWAKGEIGAKTVTIPVKTDKTVEGDEFFTLQLAEPVGMELGEGRVCTVTILDANDKTLKTTVTPYKPKKGEAVSTNSVTVAAGNEKGGFVSGTGEYTAGSKLTLTAEQRPGWSFVGWRLKDGDGTLLSEKTKWQIVVTNDAEYEAVFEQIPYVRGLADPADGGKVSGSGLCAAGKKVTLKATANKNFTFLGWCQGTGNGEQGTGNGEQGTGNGEQGTGNGEQGTGNGEQGTGNAYVATTASLVIDRSAKPAKDSKTSTTITNLTGDVTYYAVFKSDPEIFVTVDATDGTGAEPTGKGAGKYVAGTITGMGKYAPGKKVTLKAAANKGYAFVGWYETGNREEGIGNSIADGLLSQAASYMIDKMPSNDVEYVAKFVTADEDKASIELVVNGEEMVAAQPESAPYQTNVWAGVYLEWPVAADALSAPTVKVSGLPSGLKFAAKPVTAKIGTGKNAVLVTNVPANTIYGAPTAASKTKTDKKTGVTTVTPSAVKVTVTTAGKSSQTYQIDTIVDPLPAWAVGSYSGGVLGQETGNGEQGTVEVAGQVSLTVDAKGKISGKALSDGLTYTLAAPYYAGFAVVDDGEGLSSNFLADVTVSWSYKEGSKTVKTNDVVQMAVQDNGIGGVAAGDGGQGLAALPEWMAWQYNWKVDPWKDVGKKFDKKVQVYAIRADGTFIDGDDAATVALDAEVTGRVTLKFAASGTVAVSGEFVTYDEKKDKYTTVKATGSATLVPVDNDHGDVFIYLTPKGLPPHVRSIGVPWPKE